MTMFNERAGQAAWLRPVLSRAEHDAGLGLRSGALLERAGQVIVRDRRLSEIAYRRPPGVTTRQWSVATRVQWDFVVCDPEDYRPVFVVDLVDPARRTAAEWREDRMTDAVCDALGLRTLRIESSALRPADAGRRIVEYVIDARTFTEAGEAEPDQPGAGVGYRDIIGRLPDGRTGYVNDLGAVARAGAVDAFVSRQLADPLLRGLHVRWKDGAAEGWAWLTVRDGGFLFERVRIRAYRLHCGVDHGRLAEDLAAAAVGERLKTLGLADESLRGRADLADELRQLRLRRSDMDGEFAFDHVSF
ncbi:DUF2726 domain-containing protein [Solwaraspora sp. WMMD406]|uniref:DUF2726 domain-containing protein n=1 Tax=Solwaraspora sp. WMMD406 TaxID=3016095 RepID=UPI002415ECDB|nr:DUF2726 domain-containing protein [Solwaraspora sp. WMMD406]MDG4766724.1 DUF2726 domain-containing protein [Solwaraspora sp. WMMD406]